jgi:hypothetical protein
VCPSAAADVSWIESGIDEWTPGQWRIGNVIPAGYPAYLRILHSAQRVLDDIEDIEDISWREVAAISGRTVTALSSFEDLLPPYNIGVDGPSDDNVGEDLCSRIAEVLAINTATPLACTFLFGVYWGPGFFPEGEAMPTVEIAGTRYSVAAGTCQAACGFSVYPAIWWPSDRRWIVVTPSDGHSTLVGCDQKAAQELLDEPAIEAWPVTRDASVPRL